MPRINRIRLINFSYNNDSRHILDETFNFHGGENALLNLANGGGKSVLVQLFFQPIIPRAKIQGRSLTGFFHKKKLPTYIMIEWKLDGNGGYLLTGIAMVSHEGIGGEEEKNRVRYFTYTSKYSGGNAFDIKHIPFAQRKGGLLEVLPFREAREMMGDKERKDSFTFGYFPEDDGERYGKRLAEFGVVQSEWRNVITKINDNEGGIEEIFQKYKTSGQLLDEWIIKTVEKAMFRDRSEAKRLEDMLEGLVREVAENERFIGEKQLLDNFLANFRELGVGLGDLVQGLDRQQKLAGKLAAFYGRLTESTTALQEKHNLNDQGIKDCQREVRHIDLEERSQDYYVRKKEYQIAREQLADAERKVAEIEGFISESKFRERVLQAARIFQDITLKKAELSGVEEKLAFSREQYDRDSRIKSLEYTLKILWEAKKDKIALETDLLSKKKQDRENEAVRTKEELGRIDGDKSCLEVEKGRLEERKRQFETREKELFRKLDIYLRRNLLGELEPQEMEKTRLELEKSRDDLSGEEDKLAGEKAAGALHLEELDRQEQEIRRTGQEERLNLHGIQRDMGEYEKKEAEIKDLLVKYGFDSSLRFDRERREALFKQEIKGLEHRMEEAMRVRDESREGLSSLKDGRLHTPGEIRELLASLDMEFDTGEAYLRRLDDPKIRQKMLEQNPILPFAFIFSKDDLERVSHSLDKLVLRRIIPFVTYEDLGAVVESAGRMARTKDQINLACLYEGRMFDKESLESLVHELEEKSRTALEQHRHLAEAHREAVADEVSCARFNFIADYLSLLEKNKRKCEELIQDGEGKLRELDEKKREIKKREQELTDQIKAAHTSWEKAAEKLTLFADFLAEEKEYQECRGSLNRVGKNIAALKTRETELGDLRERVQEEIMALREKLAKNKEKEQEARSKCTIYEQAEETEIAPGDILELEARLAAIKEEYGSDISSLEERKRSLHLECNHRKKELDHMKLPEGSYAEVNYDEDEAAELRERINHLEKELKEQQLEEKDAARKEGAAKGAFDTALVEVIKLGAEIPLPKEEIRGGFAERRKKVLQREKELADENKNIDRSIRCNDEMQVKIRQLVDPEVTMPEEGFVPEEHAAAQLERLAEDYHRLEKENRQGAIKYRSRYADLKTDYREQNQNIDHIFKGLDPLWEKGELAFEDFYYLYERMMQHREKLGELIRIYEVQLANLERDKRDMVQQSFLHGMMIYEEIQWISDNSKVRIQGRTRPVQMLKIEMQPDKEQALERMQEYIDDCIRKVREETRENKREDEIRKTIARQMASRELLNVYLGNTHISVSVFKIELNMANSRLKLWEDAVRENSGGEKFVVFFSVLSALMAYTRARTLEAAGGDADSDTRVLIMDNPFGPISSEHLLNPLFEIAKRHRTQLICLSDLKQNSIMNCFNLIYMLKVRTSAIGSNEYLKFEEIIRDDGEITFDERLEKAVLRVSDIKQISLFED
ncbi:MAG: hypothetical protein AAGU27_17500 [Dehalobacterium sp.]